ncbi:MAG: pantetheine-phosphate adenylyltransferase [Eubacteriales bacterium]|nr:pantetheine-phosphate adenylyltransferase [Eubacteriales bacterium]
MKIIYPGSFDPFTKAHEALCRRVLAFADELVILFAENQEKNSYYSLKERMAFAYTALKDCDKIKIDSCPGLLADYFRESQADAVLRGLRNTNDLQYEQSMAEANRLLCPNLETVLLLSWPEHSWMSSSLARELASFGAPLEAILPKAVIEAHSKELYRHCKDRGEKE